MSVLCDLGGRGSHQGLVSVEHNCAYLNTPAVFHRFDVIGWQRSVFSCFDLNLYFAVDENYNVIQLFVGFIYVMFVHTIHTHIHLEYLQIN